MAYRWVHTDAALTAQLELAAEGVPGTLVEPGHAAVRFSNPTTGGDALTTMRTQMHRLGDGAGTPPGGAPAASGGAGLSPAGGRPPGRAGPGGARPPAAGRPPPGPSSARPAGGA